MSSAGTGDLALSGTKRPRGRPAKPEDEKQRARMWRCTLVAFSESDRAKLRSCGANQEMTKRFAMRERDGKLEALFSFHGSAKRAAQLDDTVLQAWWQPLSMAEWQRLVHDFDESRDDTHQGVAPAVSDVGREGGNTAADPSKVNVPALDLPQLGKAPRFWTSLADALGSLRAEMVSGQVEPLSLPSIDPRALRIEIPRYELGHLCNRGPLWPCKMNSWARAIEGHVNGLIAEQKQWEGLPRFLEHTVGSNPRRHQLRDGTSLVVAQTHDGPDESSTVRRRADKPTWTLLTSFRFRGVEFALAAFLHVLYCIVEGVSSHLHLPFTPKNHLLPELVSERCTLKVIMRSQMFESVMREDKLLQAKYQLARVVLNCPDSPALRCLCLCEPDTVLSDPDCFMDTVYEGMRYEEPWFSGKEVLCGEHLRCRYRCSMYSEFLYGAPMIQDNQCLLRCEVNRLEDLLCWAESRAVVHRVEPPLLGGSPCNEAECADVHSEGNVSESEAEGMADEYDPF